MFLRPKFLLFILVASLASACGLKGPLYRPDEAQDQAVTPSDDPTAAAKKKQSEPVRPPDPDRPAVPPQQH